MKEMFCDDSFLSSVADKLVKKIDLNKLKDKVNKQGALITKLNEEVESLKISQSNLEFVNKQNNVRIYGMGEVDLRDLKPKVMQLFEEKMNLDISAVDFECFKGGNNTLENRPVIVKFLKSEDKFRVLKKKKLLKGSKMGLMEDLPRYKYELYRKAYKELGTKDLWTFRGRIFLKWKGTKVEIMKDADIVRCKSR